jgi:hypothetical protein
MRTAFWRLLLSLLHGSIARSRRSGTDRMLSAWSNRGSKRLCHFIQAAAHLSSRGEANLPGRRPAFAWTGISTTSTGVVTFS